MAKLTYDGSAKDSEYTPAEIETARDPETGKPRKRVLRKAGTEFFPLDPFPLHGKMFPAGEAVEVEDESSQGKALIAKAKALGFFKIEGEAKKAKAS